MATGLKFLGFFFAFLCLEEGHRDPRDHVWRGGGTFSAPSGPFFTRTCVFFPAPGCFFVFFLFFGLRGPDWIARRCCVYLYTYIYIYLSLSLVQRMCSKNGMSNSKICSENAPELSESSARRSLKILPLSRPPLFSSYVGCGGNAVRF